MKNIIIHTPAAVRLVVAAAKWGVVSGPGSIRKFLRWAYYESCNGLLRLSCIINLPRLARVSIFLGANKVDVTMPPRKNPILLAIKSNSPDVVRVLINAGVDINRYYDSNPTFIPGSNYDLTSPLDVAVGLGRLEILKLLIEHKVDLKYSGINRGLERIIPFAIRLNQRAIAEFLTAHVLKSHTESIKAIGSFQFRDHGMLLNTDVINIIDDHLITKIFNFESFFQYGLTREVVKQKLIEAKAFQVTEEDQAAWRQQDQEQLALQRKSYEIVEKLSVGHLGEERKQKRELIHHTFTVLQDNKKLPPFLDKPLRAKIIAGIASIPVADLNEENITLEVKKAMKCPGAI